MPDALERFHWVDLFEEDGFSRLMRALKTRASELERSTVQIPESHELSPDLASVSETKRHTNTLERGIAAFKETFSKFRNLSKRAILKAMPFFRIVGIIGIIIILFWMGSWALPRLFSVVPTAKSSTTPAFTVSPSFIKTSMPNLTPSKAFSATPIETIETPTLTPVSPTIKPIFEDSFTDGEIATNPTWTASNDAFYIKDKTLYSDGLNRDQSDRYLGNFTSKQLIPFGDYVEFSYRGLLKSQGSPQVGRGIQMVLGSNTTDKNYELNIQKGYTNGFPTNKYSISLSLGTASTITDLILTSFEPNYDQFYDIKAVLLNGTWTLFVDGVAIGSANDPDGLTQIDVIVLNTVGSVGIDNIQVAIKPSSQSAIPYPTEITDSKGVTMRLVPAGEFTMGSDSGESDEKPVHAVHLDAYHIDKYEVTNAFYQACVDAKACEPPQDVSSISRSSYYGNPEFDHYPVMHISWNMAKTYCEWRGAQLPTEAQWEKAARGTDERTYPWGEGIDQTFANFGQSGGDTTAVGTYEKGKSPYGVYDMAGNVWEWVGDWYSSTFYANSPSTDPGGPGDGQYRVLRGGTWYYDNDKVRAAERSYYDPNEVLDSFGFRCAKSAP